jgi:chitinase
MDSLNAGKGEVKTLISIGGWSFSQGETPTFGISTQTVFSSMAASPTSRAAFISSAFDFAANRHNFDGIDLDWEYPEEADRENFIALLAEMRVAIDEDGRGLLFTAALPAGMDRFNQIVIDRVASYLDFVNLRCLMIFMAAVSSRMAPFSRTLPSSIALDTSRMGGTFRRPLQHT